MGFLKEKKRPENRLGLYAEQDKFLRKQKVIDVLKVGGMALCYSVMLGLATFNLGTAIHGSKLREAVLKMDDESQRAKTELVESINNRVGEISNFDLTSLELLRTENNYICRVFGVTDVKKVLNERQNKFVNLLFEISEKDASDIMTAVNKVDGTGKTASYNTPEHSLKVTNYDDLNWGDAKKVENTSDVLVEVYHAIDSAVKNAYGYEIEEIADSGKMNEQILSSVGYSKAASLTDEHYYERFKGVDSRFLNGGLITTGITGVMRDFRKNESYFYVDTLQLFNDAKEGKKNAKLRVESCRAKVTVEGANLSQEEVYAMFIKGEHTGFDEVIREKTSPKTGTYKGEVYQDVEEIELY